MNLTQSSVPVKLNFNALRPWRTMLLLAVSKYIGIMGMDMYSEPSPTELSQSTQAL